MRVNWFSPLPPAKTAIAHYTAQTLPALAKQGEIVAWTDQPEWDPALENFADVRRFNIDAVPWAELNRADMSIYHIGNNPLFHASIWEVSRRQPGVVILHDLCLHNFFAGVYREQRDDHAGYGAQLERYYGVVGRRDAEAFWGGRLSIEYMAEHYPLTSLATEYALGVLVHTQEGLDVLQREAHFPIVYVPLPYRASARLPQALVATKRFETRDQLFRLIMFGYLDVNRRLDVLLQALAGLPERERFHLDIYGQVWSSRIVEALIGSLGLQSLVTVHGFVPEEELEAALAAAHLAVNLRFPTMGEASAAQLRIWDHALPSLVTLVGWYATLPEDTVAFVRPDHEGVDIQSHLRALLADPNQFAKMGESGRRRLEAGHTPEAYAEAVMALVIAAQRFRPYATGYELAKRVEAELRAWRGQHPPLMDIHAAKRPRAVERREGDGPPQTIAIQGIRQAVAEQVEALRRQRAKALQEIRQAVADQNSRFQR